MRRTALGMLLITAAGLAACGGGDVVVEARLGQGTASGAASGESVVLKNLPVYLLPYDRDAIFDSLGQAYPEPEPQIPDTLVQLQQEIVQAQRQWQDANTRWNAVRDSLRSISNRMEELSRGSGEYVALFREFNALEEEEQQLKQAADSSFARFDRLTRAFNAQSQEIMIRRRNWADEAFEPVDSVIDVRLESLGLEEHADTTNASGVARFEVKPGQWWVFSRYDRQFDELYWNVPVEVPRGEELRVELTQENAQVRRKL